MRSAKLHLQSGAVSSLPWLVKKPTLLTYLVNNGIRRQRGKVVRLKSQACNEIIRISGVTIVHVGSM